MCGLQHRCSRQADTACRTRVNYTGLFLCTCCSATGPPDCTYIAEQYKSSCMYMKCWATCSVTALLLTGKGPIHSRLETQYPGQSAQAEQSGCLMGTHALSGCSRCGPGSDELQMTVLRASVFVTARLLKVPQIAARLALKRCTAAHHCTELLR